MYIRAAVGVVPFGVMLVRATMLVAALYADTEICVHYADAMMCVDPGCRRGDTIGGNASSRYYVSRTAVGVMPFGVMLVRATMLVAALHAGTEICVHYAGTVMCAHPGCRRGDTIRAM